MSEYPSIRALEAAKTRAEVSWMLDELDRLRRTAGEADHHTSKCPCCGCGLKKRLVPGADSTFFLCPNCSWNKMFPFAIDSARELDDEFIPGITGVPRGTIVCKIGLDGKIQGVEGV